MWTLPFRIIPKFKFSEDIQKKIPFSMAIGNVELSHECFPEHLRMGTPKSNKI